MNAAYKQILYVWFYLCVDDKKRLKNYFEWNQMINRNNYFSFYFKILPSVTYRVFFLIWKLQLPIITLFWYYFVIPTYL